MSDAFGDPLGGTPSDAPAGPVRVPGVAEALPAGERVLWQGSPRRALLARHVLHVRLAGLYFAVTAGWWALRTAPAMPAAQARPLLSGVTFCEDPYDCATGADALVIVTEWDQFRALDFDRVKEALAVPVVVDLRNIYRPEDMRRRGFHYVSVGR